jgi:uncharacterized membrane protein YdjX (TVP38/TMEM64 family)
MTAYLLLFAVVLGVNLMPAFGPPTWTILVLFTLQSDLSPMPTVLIAAAAAAIGRLLLAYAFRLLGHRLPKRLRRNLDAARAAIEKKRRSALLALGLFALSPVPSAQLFEAAGLSGARLLPFTAAFFAGRIVSYGIFVSGAAHVRATSMGDAFRHAITSPTGIAIELAMIAALIAFVSIDWRKWTGRRAR